VRTQVLCVKGRRENMSNKAQAQSTKHKAKAKAKNGNARHWPKGKSAMN